MIDNEKLIEEAREVVRSWDLKGSWNADSPIGMLARMADALEATEKARAGCTCPNTLGWHTTDCPANRNNAPEPETSEAHAYSRGFWNGVQNEASKPQGEPSQRCTYCGEEFPQPVSLHHDEAECVSFEDRVDAALEAFSHRDASYAHRDDMRAALRAAGGVR